jgi:mannitol/fructose-specific phosphotransferase system IIA component (Ntr-type)
MSPHSTNAAASTTWSLAEIFPESAIHMPLESRSKEGLVRELIRQLVNVGAVLPESEAALVNETMARETLGTTALGNGVAFPHCCTTYSDRLVGALGIDHRGVRFESLDGGPVYAIFLLVAPRAKRDLQYEILGKIAALGRDKGIRTQLRGCRNAAAAHRILLELE